MFFCRKIGNNNIHSAYVYDMEFTQHMEFTLQKHGTWYAKVSGWWYTYPSEKWWSSSVGMIFLFPTEWKVIQNSMVPHQPDYIVIPIMKTIIELLTID